MTIKHHESPFHVTHSKEKADKMVRDVDASIGMTPSQRAVELGAPSLAAVARHVEQSERTLINWYNNPKKRALFDAVCRDTANREAEK